MTLNQKYGLYISPVVSGGDEGMPSGYVDGCEAFSIPISGIIFPGRCRSDDNSEDIVIPSQLTATITSTGANGRNVDSAEQNSTWYALCVIKNSATGEIAAFLINENDLGSFTWPTGYDKKRRVAWLYNSAGGDLQMITTHGRGKSKRVHYTASRPALQALAGGSATSWDDVDLSQWVPPGQVNMSLLNVVYTPNGTSFVELRLKSALPSDPPHWVYADGIVTVNLELGTDDDRVIQYECDDGSDNVDIYVRGYIDEL